MEAIESFLLIIGALTGIAIGLLLLKRVVPLHWRRLTLPTMTWYAYVAFLVVPSIGIVTFEGPPVGYFTLGLVILSGVAIPIGVSIAGTIWRSRPEEIHRFYGAGVEAISPSQRKKLLFVTGLVLLFSLLFFVETGIPPFVQAILHPGDYNLLIQLRQRVTTDLHSPFGAIYFMVRQFGWAFILSCWFGVGWGAGWGILRWIGWIFLFCFGLFFCSATLTRSPSVVIFIVIFLFYYLLRHGKIPVFIIFMTIVLSLSIPTVVLFLHNPARSWESIWKGIGERVFCVPAKLNLEYIEIFPEEIEFLYGRGIGKLSSFFGLFDPNYEYFPVSREVYKRIFPTSPYQGSAPAPFIGMAYANWGAFGPPLYALLIGFVLQTLQIWLVRQRKNSFTLATQATLFYSFFEINRTDFFVTLLSYGGLVLPMLLLFLQVDWCKQVASLKGLFLWRSGLSPQ